MKYWSLIPLLIAVVSIATLSVLPAKAAVTIPGAQARVSFTFDDGFASAITKAAPVLASDGFTGTEYIATSFIDTPDYMTWAQAKELQNTYHWEIGSHSVTHPLLTQFGKTRIEKEVAQSKAILQTQGFNPTTFATPYGDYDNNVLALIAKYYVAHRPFHDQDHLNIWPNSDYRIFVVQVQGGVSVSMVKGYINQAKQNNQWLVMVFHDIKDVASPLPDDYEYSTSDLKTIADYVKQQGIIVSPLVDGIVSGGPNLMPNPTFDAGVAQGWSTDQPNRVQLDNKNNGSFPSPKNALTISAANKVVNLYSPMIDVNSSNSYVIKAFLNLLRVSKGGALTVSINEFDASNKQISSQQKTSSNAVYVEKLGFGYTPSSSAVKKARLQFTASPNKSINAYLDTVEWYQVN